MKVKSESEVAQSCPTLSDPMDCNLPGSLQAMGFSRQEYWSEIGCYNQTNCKKGEKNLKIKKLYAEDKSLSKSAEILVFVFVRCDYHMVKYLITKFKD